MDQVTCLAGFHGRQTELGRRDIVANELGFIQSANLGMEEDRHVAVSQTGLPATGLGQISLDHLDIGMKLGQLRGIGRVFVCGDNFEIRIALEHRDQVLTDQAGRTGNEDLLAQFTRLSFPQGRKSPGGFKRIYASSGA